MFYFSFLDINVSAGERRSRQELLRATISFDFNLGASVSNFSYPFGAFIVLHSLDYLCTG